MIQHYDIPDFHTEGLAALITQASTLEISARFQYFYDLFPYAENLPGSLALMDHNSKILACNEYSWKQVKLENATQLIDHTSDEVEKNLGWQENLIGRARKNDILVLREGQSIFQEIIVDSGFEKVLVCKKQAIYDDNEMPLGILSLALPILKNNPKISLDKEKQKILLHLNSNDSICLSMREFVILREILHGKSSAEIANQIHISAKTVETYVMRIKTKLDCDKQRQIIAMLIKFDLASAIIESRIDHELFCLN
jgi:DNA-binding CsgD family transcriptional regulator